MRFSVSVAALAAALFVAAPASTQSFSLKREVEPEVSVDLRLQRLVNFEANVRLSVRTDPALVPSARLVQLVESIGMIDDAGLQISRGAYDIDTQRDIVVGYSGGTAEIVKVRDTPAGLQIAALFKDNEGRISEPALGTIAAYRTGGERLCFERAQIDTVEQAPPMVFNLLIDRSGSMAPVMDQVREAAKTFLDDLPDHANCGVASFASQWSVAPRKDWADRSCRASSFELEGLEAGGGTDLFGPLAEFYSWMNRSQFTDHQKAVIIITDGRVNGQLERKAAVEAAKGDVLTLVYFLGASDDAWLQGLADSYIAHRGDLTAQLGRYFEVLSDAWSKQTVLQLKSCAAVGGGHAKP
ncbi:MAG: vWA domain-containing protein [Pseudomonadota bacterium]